MNSGYNIIVDPNIFTTIHFFDDTVNVNTHTHTHFHFHFLYYILKQEGKKTVLAVETK